MKRVIYVLRDITGSIRARIVAPEGESVALEPAMIHNVVHRGWRLESWSTTEKGVAIHGLVDWKTIAAGLAGAAQTILDGSEPDPEVRMDHLQSALEQYQIGEMEEGLGVTTPEEDEDHAEGA